MLPPFLGDGGCWGGQEQSAGTPTATGTKVQPGLDPVVWELVALSPLDLQELSQPPGPWNLNTSHPRPALTQELFVKAHAPIPSQSQCLNP